MHNYICDIGGHGINFDHHVQHSMICGNYIRSMGEACYSIRSVTASTYNYAADNYIDADYLNDSTANVFEKIVLSQGHLH